MARLCSWWRRQKVIYLPGTVVGIPRYSLLFSFLDRCHRPCTIGEVEWNNFPILFSCPSSSSTSFCVVFGWALFISYLLSCLFILVTWLISFICLQFACSSFLPLIQYKYSKWEKQIASRSVSVALFTSSSNKSILNGRNSYLRVMIGIINVYVCIYGAFANFFQNWIIFMSKMSSQIGIVSVSQFLTLLLSLSNWRNLLKEIVEMTKMIDVPHTHTI